MNILFVLFFGLTMTAISSAQNKKPADVIFLNGDIYSPYSRPVNATVKTGTPNTDVHTAVHSLPATAIAVSKGKIILIGSNQDVEKLKGSNTEVVNLLGHFVMPGFNDAHVHLSSAGFEKLNVDLV